MSRKQLGAVVAIILAVPAWLLWVVAARNLERITEVSVPSIGRADDPVGRSLLAHQATYERIGHLTDAMLVGAIALIVTVVAALLGRAYLHDVRVRWGMVTGILSALIVGFFGP